jgi:hypothetical protein
MKKLLALVVLTTFSVGVVMAQSNEKVSPTKTVSDKSKNTEKTVKKELSEEQLKYIESRTRSVTNINRMETPEQSKARRAEERKNNPQPAKKVKTEEK